MVLFVSQSNAWCVVAGLAALVVDVLASGRLSRAFASLLGQRDATSRRSAMVNIEITHDSLRVHLHGWDKLYALRGSLSVPLSHVAGARANPPEARFDEVIVDPSRGMGTYRPGTMAVGTVMLLDGRSFFDVHASKNVVAIDLRGDRLQHIVVEIDGESAESVVSRIEWAMLGRFGAAE
jgi:hypothetical protein